jgi:hypothetical protein
MLFKKIMKHLEDIEFKRDSQDVSVTNRITDGKRQTITWCFNNLKVSHVDTKLNDFSRG